MIRPWNTELTDEPFFDRYLHEVGCFLVIQPTEGNNFSHRHIIPVSERTDDMRYFASFYRLEMRIDVCHAIDFLSVVISAIRIFYLWQHRNTLGPDEECKYVLTAVPAFMVIFGAYLPSSGIRQKFLETKVTLNYQLRTRFTANANFIIFIDTLWLHQIHKFDAFTDVSPHKLCRSFVLHLQSLLFPNHFDKTLFHWWRLVWTILELLELELFAERWNNFVGASNMTTNSMLNPIYSVLVDAIVTGQVQHLQRLRLGQKRSQFFECWLDQAATSQV